MDSATKIRIYYDFLVVASGVTCVFCTIFFHICSYPIAKEKGQTQDFRIDWMLHESKKITNASSVIVVGAGATGIELATNVAAKHHGVAVKIIEQEDLLPRYPSLVVLRIGFFQLKKVRDYVIQQLQSLGITLLTNHKVENIETNGTGYYVSTNKSKKLEVFLLNYTL